MIYVQLNSSDWVNLVPKGFTTGMVLLNEVGPAIEYSTASTPTTGTTISSDVGVVVNSAYLWVRGYGDCKVLTQAEYAKFKQPNPIPVYAIPSAQGIEGAAEGVVIPPENRAPIRAAANGSLVGTLAVLGDSRGALAYSFTAAGVLQSTIPRQAVVWLNYYLGGPWRYVALPAFSVAGERTDEWADGQAAILALPTPPNFVHITFPTNDIGQGVNENVTIGILNGYIDAHVARGSELILQKAGAKSTNTSEMWRKIRAINAWIDAKAAVIGALVIDTLTPTADPVTGAFAATYSYDNLHEAAPGAARQAVFNAPKFLHRARRRSRMSRANLWETAAYNPGMSGNASGLPTGWGAYGQAGVRSKVARADIPAEWARAVFTSAADTEYVGLTQSIIFGTAWATGAKSLGVRVKGSFGDHWLCTTAGTSSGTEPVAMAAASLPGDTVTDSGGVVWTRVATIVPGVSRVTISAEVLASGSGGHQPRIIGNFGSAVGDLTFIRAMSPNAADTLAPIASISSDVVPVLTTPTVVVPADATTLSLYIYCQAANGVALTLDIGRVLVEVE